MIFYANPTIQHGSLHLQKLKREAITDEQVSKVVKPLMQLAQDLQIEILDGRQMTEARWYASHDGIHYSWSSFDNELRPTTDVVQWQGGVSWMITTVLLNLICNGRLCVFNLSCTVCLQLHLRTVNIKGLYFLISANVSVPYRP